MTPTQLSCALAAAFASAMLASTPSNAAAPAFNDPAYGWPVVGELELGVGPFVLSEGSDHENLGIVDGAARANVALPGMWNAEIELTGQSLWDREGDSLSSYGPYVHLWKKLPSAAVGFVGGVGFGQDVGELTTFTTGLEGQVYVGNATIGGQATYNWGSLSSINFNMWNARGYANYYFNPNTKIGADVSYADFSVNGGSAGSATELRLTGVAERRFANTPWSVWGSGSFASLSATGLSEHASVWTGLVGFRLFLDQPNSTLMTHDHEVPFRYDGGMDLFGI